MSLRTPIIERAFRLAKSGRCESVKDVRAKLKAEGYDLVDQHIDGPALLKKLKQCCAQPASAITASAPWSSDTAETV